MIEAMTNVLRAHALRWPHMTVQDAVKLVYQSTFGCGHMIRDEASALAWIRRERAEVAADPTLPLFEKIGGGFMRLHLAAAGELSDELICRMFCATAAHGAAENASLEENLGLLRRVCADGVFSFSVEELDAYLAGYRRDGCPAVHHSAVYRDAYAPAYRVVRGEYARLLPLIRAADELLAVKPSAVIAIDGCASAGKTTAAACLRELFGGATVHMDHFFLPLSLRNPERLAEPGGNVDYDRFVAEVAEPLKRRTPLAYGVFDCSVMACTHTEAVDPRGLTVVEGSYSLHPKFGDLYDLRVFLSVSPETQKARILARNGADRWPAFRDRWIPMETRYAEAFSIPQSAGLRVEMD